MGGADRVDRPSNSPGFNSSLSHRGRVMQPPWSSDPLTLLQGFRERLNKKCDGSRVNNKHIFTLIINNLPDHQLHEGQ